MSNVAEVNPSDVIGIDPPVLNSIEALLPVAGRTQLGIVASPSKKLYEEGSISIA